MRRARGALVALAALLLAGCGGLGGTGPVEPGLEVGSGNAPDLGIVYPGPNPGASQAAIVRGFLSAGASTGGQYDNARLFLTASRVEDWNPDRTIVLLASDDPVTVALVDPVTVTVTARPAGVVDAGGRYTAALPGASISATFRLTTVGGQWRIAELPDGFGRWLLRSEAEQLVRPFAVHYVSASRRAIVPDIRWFPLDRLATRLARAQLAPVPAHLEGAVSTAVPAGTRLLGDSVSVDRGGTASVDLVGGRLAPGEVTRQNLWAQFVATLTQDPTVARVSLAVGGTAVDLAGLDGPAATLPDVGFADGTPAATARPVVRRGAQVTVFDPTGAASKTAQPPNGQYPNVPAAYTHLALAADGAETAAVNPGGGGISRWKGTNRYEVGGVPGPVGAPSYDLRGFLWVGGSGTGGERLFVVDTSADPADPTRARATAVRADWLAGRRVLEARVAPDGDRLAVLSTAADGSDVRIDLSGVVRGSGGRPERLAAPLRLGRTLASASGLVWLDETSLATIGAEGRRAPTPTIVTVGGQVRALTAVPGARALTTTGGERGLYVVTSTGRLVVRSSSQWSDAGAASDLAVPGG